MSTSTLLQGDQVLMTADVITKNLKAKHKIKGLAYLILGLIHKRGEMNMGAIGTALGASPSSLTDQADLLEGRGMVQRVRQSDDRRSVCLRLTDPGTRFYLAVRGSVDAMAASLMD